MPARILVVEDEAIVAMGIASTLANLGHKVVSVVATGTEALDAAARLRPDLVLMDVVLSGPMDGIEASERLRQMHGIPVVYLTAYSDAATLGRAKETEPYGYIVKPFQEKDLEIAIDMALYRHDADRRIAHAERRFAAVFDQAFQYIAVLTPEGLVTEANRSLHEALGASAPQFEGRPLWRASWWKDAPQELERVRQGIRQAAAGLPVRLESCVSGLRAPEVCLDVSIKPLTDRAGAVTGVLFEARDVTDLKRAHQALARRTAELEDARKLAVLGESLRLSEERLRAIAQNAPIVLFVIDHAGRIGQLEGRSEELIGLPAPDVIGRPVEDVFADNPRFVESFRRALAGETLRDVVGHAGKYFDVWFSPLLGAAGTVDGAIGVMGVGSDITERRELEEQLRSQLERLREVEQLKQDFVDAVTHELRTPLAVIVGYSELVGEVGPLTPQQRGFLEMIARASRRQEILVNSLLDYARIEAGTFELRREDSDLRRVVTDVVAFLRPLADEAGVALEGHVPDSDLPVRIDPVRIEQVVTNLVANAIKFTPRGGSVRVRAHRDAGHAVCEVADTGTGISEVDLPRLFVRFSQLREGKQRGGTGLGLAISKVIVEAHGGTIGVMSRVGEGSTFFFTLPEGAASQGVATPWGEGLEPPADG
ncbi:MAG: PAS domain S-box protein [Candidatus Sericytochromatia bacterium]|nr:PAS domain S-box protein [Candidatus Tanganyikabacteria bacterium]